MVAFLNPPAHIKYTSISVGSNPRKRSSLVHERAMALPTQSTLPTDLVLEIVARSDTSTLVRCAAACKLLRHDILEPSFLHRVTRQGGVVPSCLLVYLKDHKCYFPRHRQPPISLVHPDTLAATSFCDNHLAPFVSRQAKAKKLLRQYDTLTSRGGLVLLLR